jgi:hypothetical protein
MRGMIIFTAIVTSFFVTVTASYIWFMNRRTARKLKELKDAQR